MRFDLLKCPKTVLVVVLLITLGLGYAMKDLEVTGQAIFVPKNDPSFLAMETIDATFSSSNPITIMLQAEGKSFITADNIAYIREVTEVLENLPGVTAVSSVTNVDYLRSEGEELLIEPLVASRLETEEQILLTKERLLSWEFYKRILFSDDFRSTQILVFPEKHAEILDQIAVVLSDAKSKGGDLVPFVAGEAVAVSLLQTSMIKNILTLLPFVGAILITILYLLFRTIGGVILPLLSVVVGTIWTMGLMALLERKLTILGTTIPLLLVSVGGAYGIHLLNHYYHVLEQRGPKERSRQVVLESLRLTLRHSWKPIVLAGISTILGFISLVSGKIDAIREMGFFASLGIFTSLLVTLVLLPSLILLRPTWPKQGVAGAGRRTSLCLSWFHRHFASRDRQNGFLALLLTATSLLGIYRLQVGTPPINFFKKGTDIRKAHDFASHHFSGIATLQVLIRGNPLSPSRSSEEEQDQNDAFLEEFSEELSLSLQEGEETQTPPLRSVRDLRLLRSVDLLSERLKETFPHQVGKVVSVVVLIKQINRVLHTDAGDDQDQALTKRLLGEILRRAVADSASKDPSIMGIVYALEKALEHRGAAFYELPSSPAKYGLSSEEEMERLISQYLYLLSGNLGSFIDNEGNPQSLLLTVQLKTNDPRVTSRTEEMIRLFSERHIVPLGYTTEITGHAKMGLITDRLVVHSQILSIFFALTAVFILLAISYRSAAIGLVGIVPVALSVLVNFGFMGFAGLRLDIATAMVASIAIGIGIDYSIHFLSTYISHKKEGLSHEKAVETTIFRTGKAISYNAISVGAGFAVLLLSPLVPLNMVGLLTCLIMLTSSFLSMSLLPALLKIAERFVKLRGSGYLVDEKS